MNNQGFAVEPQSRQVNETEVYAQVCLESSKHIWNVTVVLSKASESPPIQGQEIDVQLLDAQRLPLRLLARPSNVLVEFGGSLGNSANALFQFQNAEHTPTQLLVKYQDQTVSFNVVSTSFCD